MMDMGLFLCSVNVVLGAVGWGLPALGLDVVHMGVLADR
jgi:hypothetical protein